MQNVRKCWKFAMLVPCQWGLLQTRSVWLHEDAGIARQQQIVDGPEVIRSERWPRVRSWSWVRSLEAETWPDPVQVVRSISKTYWGCESGARIWCNKVQLSTVRKVSELQNSQFPQFPARVSIFQRQSGQDLGARVSFASEKHTEVQCKFYKVRTYRDSPVKGSLV